MKDHQENVEKIYEQRHEWSPIYKDPKKNGPTELLMVFAFISVHMKDPRNQGLTSCFLTITTPVSYSCWFNPHSRTSPNVWCLPHVWSLSSKKGQKMFLNCFSQHFKHILNYFPSFLGKHVFQPFQPTFELNHFVDFSLIFGWWSLEKSLPGHRSSPPSSPCRCPPQCHPPGPPRQHGMTRELCLDKDMGVSENSVPLNPMVNDHYPY